MEQAPTMISFAFLIALVVGGLTVVGLIAFAIFAAVRGSSRRAEQHHTHQPARTSVGSIIAIVAGGFLCLLLFFGLFASFTMVGYQQHEMALSEKNRARAEAEEHQIATRANRISLHSSSSPDAVDGPLNDSKPPIELAVAKPIRSTEWIYDGNRVTTNRTDGNNLPKWINDDHSDDSHEYEVTTGEDHASSDSYHGSHEPVSFVLHSQRYGSIEEARAELWSKASRQLQDRIIAQHPVMKGWVPSQQTLKQANILKREAEVVYPLVIDEFEEEVIQLHWDIKLDDISDERIYASWQPTESFRRVSRVGGVMGLLTAVLGIGAFFTRRREAS